MGIGPKLVLEIPESLDDRVIFYHHEPVGGWGSLRELFEDLTARTSTDTAEGYLTLFLFHEGEVVGGWHFADINLP